jgi:GTPase
MKVLRQAAAEVGIRRYAAVVPSIVAARSSVVGHHHLGYHHGQQRRTIIDIVVDPKSLSRSTKKDSGNSKKHNRSNRPSYRFVDRIRIRVSGGRGGKGSLSAQSLRRKHKLRPDGGHGGDGGSVIIVADPNEQTLSWSHPHIQAEQGTNGSSQEKFGRNGRNLILRVPCGVVVKRIINHGEEWDEETRSVRKLSWRRDQWEDDEVEQRDLDDLVVKQKGYDIDLFPDNDSESDEEEEEDNSDDVFKLRQGLEIDVFPEDDAGGDDAGAEAEFFSDEDDTSQGRHSLVLADLDESGAHVLVARGGRGGIGTCVYSKEHGPLPDARVLITKAKPKLGEVAFLELELKLIADLGLVGFPNAGEHADPLLRNLRRRML